MAPLIYKELFCFFEAKRDEKKWGPKYAGISNDVYENKRRKKSPSGKSNDVYEKKQVMVLIRRYD